MSNDPDVQATSSEGRYAVRRICLIAAAILFAVAGLYGVVVLVNVIQWQRGKARAENDWNSGNAVLFTNDAGISCEHGIYFKYNYDRETGLLLRSMHYDTNKRFYDGYNSTISQLLKANGVPPWSVRDYVLADKELTTALQSLDLKRVAAFPAEVSDSIVIVSGGVFSRWGCTSSGPGIRIETRRGATIGVGEGKDTVYVGRSLTRPRVVLIRMGNRWVGVFHEDGRFISSAYVAE